MRRCHLPVTPQASLFPRSGTCVGAGASCLGLLGFAQHIVGVGEAGPSLFVVRILLEACGEAGRPCRESSPAAPPATSIEPRYVLRSRPGLTDSCSPARLPWGHLLARGELGEAFLHDACAMEPRPGQRPAVPAKSALGGLAIAALQRGLRAIEPGAWVISGLGKLGPRPPP